MEVFKFVLIGVAAAILSVFVKSVRPEFAILISISAGILLFMLALSKISEIIGFIASLSSKYNLDLKYIGVALKIVGIACVSDIGVQICKDANENAIASKVELGGKLIILIIAIPVMQELLALISSIITL